MLMCSRPVLHQVRVKKFRFYMGTRIKSIQLIFKTEMLIYESKANLDVRISFGKAAHLLDLEIRACLHKPGLAPSYKLSSQPGSTREGGSANPWSCKRFK